MRIILIVLVILAAWIALGFLLLWFFTRKRPLRQLTEDEIAEFNEYMKKYNDSKKK